MNYLNEKLISWGADERRIPDRNDDIKATVVTHLTPPTSGVVHVPPATHRLPWLSLAFAILAIIAFVAPSSSPTTRLTSPASPTVAQDEITAFKSESLSIGAAYRSTMPSPTIYPFPVPENPPAADTREYLKTDYGATIRTRRVQDVGNRTMTMVRGYGGRIDSSSLSDSSGRLSFALPATKLDAFRAELATIAGARFITEQTSTQNLLPEKRVIESAQEDAGASVARLERERSSLIASFRRTEADLNARIAAAATDDERRALQDELDRARQTYLSRRGRLDSQLQVERDRLAALDRQTSDLLDNVATVRGSVSLYKISLYGILNTYLHGYAVPLALLILTIGTYARYRWMRFPSPPYPIP